jgi:predicted RNA methylase
VNRDWRAWHAAYADPGSSLSRRAQVVRGLLADVLATSAGPVRLLSLCAGEGRDTLSVLATSPIAVAAVLVELDPVLATTARRSAEALGLVDVEVRTADAGTTTCAAGAVPADVVMLCGVFGNIDEADLDRTVATLPALLAPGAHVIWTRGRGDADVDAADTVRRHFTDAGFDELEEVRPADASFRVGLHRWSHPGRPYEPGVRMFSFFR